MKQLIFNDNLTQWQCVCVYDINKYYIDTIFSRFAHFVYLKIYKNNFIYKSHNNCVKNKYKE